jgi:hypothetical protein
MEKVKSWLKANYGVLLAVVLTFTATLLIFKC